LELTQFLSALTPAQKNEIAQIVDAVLPDWAPLPGQQTLAYESEADEVYYGGAAGGAKSDLLLGMGLTHHHTSIVYRREATQLEGLTRRLIEMLGSNKGWNDSKHILKRQGKILEFGSCKDAGDEVSYQGRPHDFCVVEGTPVLMADGQYRPIESIRAGDYVATLEGPRPVQVGARTRFDKAVLVCASSPEGQARQIQGVDHSLLTSEGWVSHGSVYEAHQPYCFFSSEDLQNFFFLSAQGLRALFPRLNIFPLQGISRFSSWRWPVSRLPHRFLQAFFSCGHLSNRGICFAMSLYRHAGALRHLLAIFPQVLALPFHKLWGLFVLQGAGSGVAGGHLASLLQGFEEHYSFVDHQCDVRVRPFEAVDPRCLLLRGGVGQPIPIGFVGDGQAGTPKHTRHKESYIHPYTMEKRRIAADFAEASLSYSPFGKVKLFDITVKSANHYITAGGFVNKNCGFDEIPHFLKSQYKFLIGWNRTTRPGQRCRVVCTGNPPTDTEGRWVVEYWAPWLDPNHPNPAKFGELRWFTTIDGKDVELPNGDPVLVEGVMVQPKSRTFIPSKITDNPFLMATGYMSTLQALPEPLRSQMLKGDFLAGVTDDAWQIFPTSWVDAAMARWTPEGKKGRMSSAGVDVARGGADHTIVAVRYDTWFDQLKKFPGSETPNGAVTAGLVISVIRDGAPVHVDALGVGGETVGHLESNEVHTVAIEGYNTELCKDQTDRGSGRLRFRNYRAMIHWRFREALDPMFGMSVDPRHPDYRAPVALFPDQKLKSDLCSIKWKMTAGGILVESKEDIKKRIGRSPDDSDAVIYCWIDTPKRAPKQQGSNWRAHKAKGSWRAQ
jgi:hypothetical protein